MFILYFIAGLVAPTVYMIYNGYRKDVFISLNQFRRDERLNVIVKDLCIVFPDLKRYQIYPTHNSTCCVNKSIIYINTTSSDDNLIIDKVLHEYAHILNKDFYGHDNKFYDILKSLYIDLNKHPIK
jgi:hypothetical protein